MKRAFSNTVECRGQRLAMVSSSNCSAVLKGLPHLLAVLPNLLDPFAALLHPLAVLLHRLATMFQPFTGSLMPGLLELLTPLLKILASLLNPFTAVLDPFPMLFHPLALMLQMFSCPLFQPWMLTQECRTLRRGRVLPSLMGFTHLVAQSWMVVKEFGSAGMVVEPACRVGVLSQFLGDLGMVFQEFGNLRMLGQFLSRVWTRSHLLCDLRIGI